MAFNIKDPETDAAVRRLARLTGKSLTETVKDAVERVYAEERSKTPLIERLRPLQAKYAALAKPGGLPPDKAFYDELSGGI